MTDLPAPGANDEVLGLIETLHATGQRLEDLTAGEVDAVVNRAGTPFLLRTAQDHLRVSEAARQSAILNALPTHIALLDSQGRIIAVNGAWRRFGTANEFLALESGVGLNYLQVCDEAHGASSEEAKAVAAGLRSVLDGETPSFSLEYPCNAPNEPRWFQLLVTPQRREQIAGAVVMHTNITHRVRAELERQQLEQRLRQAEKLASLGQLAASIARDLNPPPGSGAAPEPARDFTSLLAHYEKLLQAAKGEAAAPELIVEAAAARAQVDEQVLLNLCQLLISLAPVAGEKPAPPAAPGPAGADPQSQQLYAALEETIAVLEQIKRSFNSPSLGQLRAKLAKLISPRA